MTRRIIWTAELAGAALAVARESDNSAWANTPDVRDRAAEIARYAKVGQALEPHQVDFVQALRSRLGEAPVSHRQFDSAWGIAWNAPEPREAAPSVRLVIEPIACDGAAFGEDEQDNTARAAELGRILRALADEVDGGKVGGALRDINGNRVGGWHID